MAGNLTYGFEIPYTCSSKNRQDDNVRVTSAQKIYGQVLKSAGPLGKWHLPLAGPFSDVMT